MNQHILNKIHLKLSPHFALDKAKFYPISGYSDLTLEFIKQNPIWYKISIGSAVKTCWVMMEPEILALRIDASSITSWNNGNDFINQIANQTKSLCGQIDEKLRDSELDHKILKYALSQVHYDKKLVVAENHIRYSVFKSHELDHYEASVLEDEIIISLNGPRVTAFSMQDPELHIKVRDCIRRKRQPRRLTSL